MILRFRFGVSGVLLYRFYYNNSINAVIKSRAFGGFVGADIIPPLYAVNLWEIYKEEL